MKRLLVALSLLLISVGVHATEFPVPGQRANQIVNLPGSVKGILSTDKGGTGAATLNDLITLGTHTTGNYVKDVADGTGIDGTAAGEGATYTPTLDLTELSSVTWGAGSFTTETFDAGATDPVFTFGSATLDISGVSSRFSVVGGTYQFGSTTSVASALSGAAVTPAMQISGTSSANSTFENSRFSADANPPRNFFNKSRGTTVGSFTVVAVDDDLGEFVFAGADGTDMDSAACFRGEVDGTPGNNDMPGRITFGTTADGSPTCTDRWIIDSVGAFKPATDDGAALGTTTKRISDLFLAEGGVINWDNGDATLTQTADDITIAGITTFGFGTSTAITLGTIELGHASDTTISRSAAGIPASEGVVLLGVTNVASGNLPAAATQTISSIPAYCAQLVVQVTGWSQATNTARLFIRIGNGSGDSTAGNYVGNTIAGTTVTNFTTNAAASLTNGGAAQTTAQTGSATCTISGPAATAHKTFQCRVVENTTESLHMGTYIGTTSAIDTIVIGTSAAGNFDAGTYRVDCMK